MDEERSLNPQTVHDAAAYLFWTLAEADGFTEASEAVIDSRGQCLLAQPFTATVLGQYGIEKLPHNDQRQFGNAIAVEAEYFAVNKQNMEGVIYADDAKSGRSPSAMHVQTATLNVIPGKVHTSGPAMGKIGLLCLRHPLPAVVFSDTKPHGEAFEVADTSAALGFHLPMFLGNVSTRPLSEHLFVSSGTFYIPVPDAHHGALWGAVIQNAIRFTEGIKLFGASGDTVVDVQW